MSEKVAIVTGASSGFGLLTSLRLAENGFKVIATMRDLNKKGLLVENAIERGIEERLVFRQLDVTSSESIHSFKEYLTTLTRIDVLVNNAGYAAAGFVEEVPVETYRQQFETNFFGVISVTQAVIPYMRGQRKGTIINVSSISGLIGFPGMSPYVSSKFALEGLSESLRLELQSFGVNVVLIEPGSFNTNIWTSGKQIAKKSMNERSPYYSLMKKIEKGLEESQKDFGDPDEVARLIVEVALGQKKKMRYPIGKGIKAMRILKNILPFSVVEKSVAKRFDK